MPTSPPVNPSPAETASRLHSAAIHLLRHLRRTDDESGVPAAQLSALSVLVFGGPRRLGSLAEAERMAPPSMSRIVAALEKTRLVKRSADPADRRAETIAATELGQRTMLTARDRRLEDLVTFLDGCSERDVKAVRRTVQLVQKFLDPGPG